MRSRSRSPTNNKDARKATKKADILDDGKETEAPKAEETAAMNTKPAVDAGKLTMAKRKRDCITCIGLREFDYIDPQFHVLFPIYQQDSTFEILHATRFGTSI
jgi:hypothetical protein